MVEKLIEIDQELLVFLNSLGHDNWDGFWLFITNKYTSVPLYLLLIILFAKKFGFKRTLLLVITGGLLVTVSDQLANVFKYGFERLRPCHQSGVQDIIRIVKGSCGGKFSYFSAHASTGMALAIFFSLNLKLVFRNLKYYLIVFALFVGYSRIYIGVHYPFDVLTGFLIGATLGFLGYRFSTFLITKFYT